MNQKKPLKKRGLTWGEQAVMIDCKQIYRKYEYQNNKNRRYRTGEAIR